MRRYLVIGNPIDHSLSPQLHNYWFKKNNINGLYEKEKLSEDSLQNLIAKIKDKKIAGINITVPFKKKIIQHLDELSSEAAKTQSVNTVALKNNKVIGYNTDISGFESALEFKKYDPNKKKNSNIRSWRSSVIFNFCFIQNESFKHYLMQQNQIKS